MRVCTSAPPACRTAPGRCARSAWRRPASPLTWSLRPLSGTPCESSDESPDPNSVAIMAHIDQMSRPMRALVREYGYAIVRDMIDEGYDNAAELGAILEVWRERRQEQWLATDYITKRTARQIV